LSVCLLEGAVSRTVEGGAWGVLAYSLIELSTNNRMAVGGGKEIERLDTNHGTSRAGVSKILALYDQDMMSWLQCSPYSITHDQDIISWNRKV